MAAVAARWYTVRMRRSTRVLCLLLFVGGFLAAPPPTGCAGAKTFSISRSDYLEKVHGWWMETLIGVTLGRPFEFRMPWPPKEVTGYVFDAPVADYFGDNDDLYVGMAYLLALDRHGAGVTQVQMAAEFFRRLEPRRLWMANQRAYMNLAAGLAPPKTGHPVFNECSWAIDAQIENDVWGVVCPGMIDTACRYADLAAHVTNHADGAYGGLFTAALASGAFAERDVETLVETALAKLPPSCDYAEAVRDVIAWHREEPGDWKKTRERIRSKWQVERGHRDESAVVNGAAVVTALLYGGGDFDTTVRIGTMAGWDTDCNAASAGGILGIILGAKGIPPQWNIFHDRYKNISLRNLPMWMTITGLAEWTAALGERTIAAHGGRLDGDRLVIPRRKPATPCAAGTSVPGGPRRDEEWNPLRVEKLALDLRLWNPDLDLWNCIADGTTGLSREFKGKRHVFRTVPGPTQGPCVLIFPDVAPPDGREEILLEISACSGDAPWDLSVAAGERELGRVRVGKEAPAGFRATTIVPRRGEDIILYPAEDGSTYLDQKLTRLAQPSPSFNPAAKPVPLRIRSAQNNVNLFRYGGKCPPGKPEIRAYYILTEWTDSPYPVAWLSPGDPHPYGCYWPKEHVPDLPLQEPKQIKLRIQAEEELPAIPEGGKFVLVHDEGNATVISLPRVSTKPTPWHRLRFDLTPYLALRPRVEVRSTPAVGEGRGEAFWEYVRIVRRPVSTVDGGANGQTPSDRRQR